MEVFLQFVCFISFIFRDGYTQFGGCCMRAYRPGRMGGEDEELVQEFRYNREEKLQVYAQRAQAGLPLFQSISEPMSASMQHFPHNSAH